jgi:hypothetical protein
MNAPTGQRANGLTDVAIDEPQVVAALESGVLLGAASRAMAVVWNAAAQSRTAAACDRALAAWRGSPVRERRLATSVLLVVAAATHVVLGVTSEMPAGWLWLVAPAAALSAALMAALTSRAATGD